MKKLTKLFLLVVVATGVFYKKENIAEYFALFQAKNKAVADGSLAVEKNAIKKASGEENLSKEDVTVTATPSVVAEKADSSKDVVVFFDGTTIKEDAIMQDLLAVPEQISSKMSLIDLKSFLVWQKAYQRLLFNAAKEEGLDQKAEIKKEIENHKNVAAGLLLLEAETQKIMTDEAVEEQYQQTWEKEIKGSKVFELIGIVTEDKEIANEIKSNVNSQESLDAILKKNASKVKHTLLDNASEKQLPPEVASAVLKKGENAIVGPFSVQEAHMLFFVKKIEDAKRQKCDKDFLENYRRVVQKTFAQKYLGQLYVKYGVSIFDVSGDKIDPFRIVDKNVAKKVAKKKRGSLSDTDEARVFAKFDSGETVTAKDVKEYFKVQSLQDETFLMMAAQFEISQDEVILYATKLVCDSLVLSKEVKKLKYDKKPAIFQKLNEMEEMELIRFYLGEKISVSDGDIATVYKKFVSSINKDDKNYEQISARVLMFNTVEEAKEGLKKITSGEEKFETAFKRKVEQGEAHDFKYVSNKTAISPEFWNMLKAGKPATCCKDILKIDGSKFETVGEYAVIYIGEKKPFVLPDLKNPNDKKMFKKMVEKEKTAALVKEMFVKKVKQIEGKSVVSEPEKLEKMVNAMS